MIDFDYSQTDGWDGIAFAMIGATLSIVLFFAARLFGLRIIFKTLEPAWYPMFLLIIPLSTIVGATKAAPAFLTVYEYRSLDLEKVNGLRVYQTDQSNGNVIDYSDIAETRNFLRSLRWCRHVDHQRDKLFDGYVLEVLTADGSDSNLYLIVYKKSTINGSRKSVVAKYRNMDSGEYDCPEIQDWINKVVDPLFGLSPNPRTVPSNSPNTAPSQRPSP
ncbi:MAG: hypothetical protein JO053_05330 [Acidobacteria bacterium]|nr:hypothetical protein [Acidobacteriota bacterium]